MTGPTGVVVGAGDRGYDAYATMLLDDPSAGRIVGVAEPDERRRRRFADRYGISPEVCHDSWEALFARDRTADFALIATGDAHHVAPTIAALEAGYHVLLEKPMALQWEECRALADAATAADRTLAVCHVYRYAPVFDHAHRLIEAGALGDVVAIQQSENVAYWHYAHSYVRGHTRRSVVPWLLQKSCHDLDVISWMAGAPAVEVSSFLRPTELTARNAPPDAPAQCIEGCPHADSCPYDAVAIYRDLEPLLGDLAMTERPRWVAPAAQVLQHLQPIAARSSVAAIRRRAEWWRWPVAALTDDHTPEGLERALRTSRWGRCVYQVEDNDQPASQVVSIRFANDVLASFMLHSTSHRSMRQFRVDGTRGSLRGELHALSGWLEVADHKSGTRRRIKIPTSFDGHGGGERRLFADFLDAIATGRTPRVAVEESLESHHIAFAAMESARTGATVRISPPTR